MGIDSVALYGGGGRMTRVCLDAFKHGLNFSSKSPLASPLKITRFADPFPARHVLLLMLVCWSLPLLALTFPLGQGCDNLCFALRVRIVDA